MRGEHPFPVSETIVNDFTEVLDARIAHHDVYPAKLHDGVAHQLFKLICARGICLPRLGNASCTENRLHSGIRAFKVKVCDADTRSLACEGKGDFPADAAACTRNDSDL